jgi:diaminopimelate decarboxylase
MDYFEYKKDQILFAEDVQITEIEKKVHTPFYCYSTATIERHFNVLNKALNLKNKLICFAVKANSNIAVIKTLGRLGAGADVVSEGEIARALQAGIHPKNIVYSGVGKSRAEIRFALKATIGQFNAESLEELDMINEEAEKLGMKANVAIRVNPDVDAKSNSKISTGRKEDKFGINIDESFVAFMKASQLPNIDLVGVATHIGSQITSLEPFKEAFTKIINLAKDLIKQGFQIRTIDLGGGLGVPYIKAKSGDIPTPEAYGNLVGEVASDLPDIKFIFEPGRLIMANSGVLVTSVILVKKTQHKNFIVVDSAMNDLLRPAMYDAIHEVIPAKKVSGNEAVFDVVGPVCETSDVFARNISMVEPKEGDLLVFRSAGAYGAVMASEYNSRKLIPEIMVKGGDFAIIRQRPTYEEMLGRDVIPEWLA